MNRSNCFRLRFVCVFLALFAILPPAYGIFSPGASVSYQNGWQWNAFLGFFQKGEGPLVYAAQTDEWIYTAGAGEAEGYFFYRYSTGQWGWASSATYPFYLGLPGGKLRKLQPDIATPATHPFTTARIAGTVHTNEAPFAGLAGVMDSQYRTHVVWVERDGSNNEFLYYTRQDANGFTPVVQLPTNNPAATKVAPFIAVDAQDQPHITYILKRDPSGLLRTGNYAIMYSRPVGGGFVETQASTNSTNPLDNTANPFNAYVNGRPTLFFEGETPVITYYAERSDNAHHIVFARRAGSGWTYSREINLNQPSGRLPGVQNGYATVFNRGRATVAWNDLSSYRVRWSNNSGGGWSESALLDDTASGFGNLRNVQASTDRAGRTWLHWYVQSPRGFYWMRADVEEDYQFITAPQFTPGGNFYPGTVDSSTGHPYFAYNSSSTSGFIVMTPGPEDSLRWVLRSEAGRFYGRQILSVRDGVISVVSYDNGRREICVTTGAL